MSAHDVKLLLADVDGTLVTKDKVLTEQAMQAARDLRAAGITLALTSGRPPRGMSMLIEPPRFAGRHRWFQRRCVCQSRPHGYREPHP